MPFVYDALQVARGCVGCGPDNACGVCTPLFRCTITFLQNSLDEDFNLLPYHVVPEGGVNGIIASVHGAPGEYVPEQNLNWSVFPASRFSVTTNAGQPQTGIVSASSYGRGLVTASLPNARSLTEDLFAGCGIGTCKPCSNKPESVCANDSVVPGEQLHCIDSAQANRIDYRYVSTDDQLCGVEPDVWTCSDVDTCGPSKDYCCYDDGMGVDCTLRQPLTWTTSLDCTP
jgi:hypothetical protein